MARNEAARFATRQRGGAGKSYLVRISEAKDVELQRRRRLRQSEGVKNNSATSTDRAGSSASQLEGEWRVGVAIWARRGI